MLPLTRQPAESFIDQLESVAPMKEDNTSSAVDFKVVCGPIKYAFGTRGHSFVKGYFVVNEAGEFVYRYDNFEEYKRIILTSEGGE